MGGGLPRRDLWLLPLVVLCTVLVLLVAAETLARAAWPEQERDACEVLGSGGMRFQPDCRSRVKVAEGPWVEYRTNRCGYRSEADCGAKPSGALRVVVLGSSISRGHWVAYRQSFAGRLEDDLAQACGRRVDVQNLAVSQAGGKDGPMWHTMADRVGEALALQPDAIVTVLGPYDLEQYTAMPGAPALAAFAPTPSWRGSAVAWLHANVVEASRAVHIAQHFFYLDLDRYIPLFLRHGDSADFLRPPFTPAWQLRLRIADETIGQVAGQALVAHVPFIVAFMPSRAEAALAAGKDRPPRLDPFALGWALARIARVHDAQFVDVTQAARDVPGVANADYYPVDGHPNGQGHAMIADALEMALVGGTPAFEGCHLPQPPSSHTVANR